MKLRRGSYLRIPRSVAQQRDLAQSAKLVLAFLIEAASNRPTLGQIAGAIGSDRKTVWHSVRALERAGFLEVVRGGRGRNHRHIYRVVKVGELPPIETAPSVIFGTGGNGVFCPPVGAMAGGGA